MIRHTGTPRMRHRLYGLGRLKLLVTEPHQAAFGHQGIDILMSMQIAKAEGAALYLIRPQKMVNRALFEVRSEQVKILPASGLLATAIKALWRMTPFIERIARPIWRSRSLEFIKQRNKKGSLNNRGANHLTVQAVSKARGRARPYVRRMLIREPIPIYLPQRRQAEVNELARQLGITPDSRIVTLHVREPGFWVTRGHAESRVIAARNARIETYDKAIDFLVKFGYTVVRMGDSSMMPVSHPGMIDLATSPHRTELLELLCLIRSEFLIGGASGPSEVAYLTNTPCLRVNTTDPFASYPVRKDGLYILKHPVERQTGHRLSLSEMLTEDYLSDVKNLTRYDFIDNSSDEILEAVREMVDTLENGPEESDVQREYRQILCRAAETLTGRFKYLRKWGPEDGFIGDGRIAHSFAVRYLFNP